MIRPQSGCAGPRVFPPAPGAQHVQTAVAVDVPDADTVRSPRPRLRKITDRPRLGRVRRVGLGNTCRVRGAAEYDRRLAIAVDVGDVPDLAELVVDLVSRPAAQLVARVHVKVRALSGWTRHDDVDPAVAGEVGRVKPVYPGIWPEVERLRDIDLAPDAEIGTQPVDGALDDVGMSVAVEIRHCHAVGVEIGVDVLHVEPIGVLLHRGYALVVAHDRDILEAHLRSGIACHAQGQRSEPANLWLHSDAVRLYRHGRQRIARVDDDVVHDQLQGTGRRAEGCVHADLDLVPTVGVQARRRRIHRRERMSGRRRRKRERAPTTSPSTAATSATRTASRTGRAATTRAIRTTTLASSTASAGATRTAGAAGEPHTLDFLTLGVERHLIGVEVPAGQ